MERSARTARLGWVCVVPIAIAFSAIAGASEPGGLTLVAESATEYVIVIPSSPAPPEQFAAGELQRYLWKMSGVELPIVRAKGTTLPPKAILVGALEVPGAPSLQARYPDDDGLVLATQGERLIVRGSNPRGTVFAVYDLLERLGCRWFAPNFPFYVGNHELVPVRRTVRLAPLNVAKQPDLRYRGTTIVAGPNYSPLPEPEAFEAIVDWLAKNKKNVVTASHGVTASWDWVPEAEKRGLLIKLEGHDYWGVMVRGWPVSGWPSSESGRAAKARLEQEHPDWLGYSRQEGRRVLKDRNFCSSNKQAVAQLTQGVRQTLAEHPQIDIFGVWPIDAGQWCECPACERLGSPATRAALLHNQMRRAVKERFPKVQMQFLSFVETWALPETEVEGEDTLAEVAPIGRCYRHPIHQVGCALNLEYATIWKSWRDTPKFGGDLGVWSYYRKMAWHSLPALFPRLISSDMRWYHENGAKGLNLFAGVPADWRTYELQHYAVARYSWQVDLSPEELLGDYCRHRFPSAPGLMFQALDELEEAMRLLHAGGFRGYLVVGWGRGLQANPPLVNREVRRRLEAVELKLRRARDLAQPEEAWSIEGLRVSVARAIHRVAAVEHEQAADYGQAQQEVARELEIIRQHPRDGIFWESITRESEAYLKELREQEQAPARP